LLEFRGSFSKKNNDCVDGATNRAHDNTANHHAHYKTEQKRNDLGVASGIIEKIRCSLDNQSDTTNHTSNNERDQKQCIGHQIICNKRLPSPVPEKSKDILAGVEIAITIESNVNKRPLVEILQRGHNQIQKKKVSTHCSVHIAVNWGRLDISETDPRALTSTIAAKQDKMHSATQAIMPASPSARAVFASILRA
jgi:hypothetical protein